MFDWMARFDLSSILCLFLCRDWHGKLVTEAPNPWEDSSHLREAAGKEALVRLTDTVFISRVLHCRRWCDESREGGGDAEDGRLGWQP